MKIKDIFYLLKNSDVTLFDVTTNKVYSLLYPDCPETVLPTWGDYTVVTLIPLDFKKLQVTIKI